MPRRLFFALLAIVMLAGAGPLRLSKDPIEVQTHLQIALQRHIDRTMIGGSLFVVGAQTGTLSRLYPIKVHPDILQGDGYFVLTVEYRDENGTRSNVDYFLVPTHRGFKVFRTEVASTMLRDLVDNGKVWKF